MIDKDIFTMLLEEELKSENPNHAVLKYGKTFLERLAVIGNQIETILLSPDIEIDDKSKVIIMTKEDLTLVRKGLAIMDIVGSEIPKLSNGDLVNKYPLNIAEEN